MESNRSLRLLHQRFFYFVFSCILSIILRPWNRIVCYACCPNICILVFSVLRSGVSFTEPPSARPKRGGESAGMAPPHLPRSSQRVAYAQRRAPTGVLLALLFAKCFRPDGAPKLRNHPTPLASHNCCTRIQCNTLFFVEYLQ